MLPSIGPDLITLTPTPFYFYIFLSPPSLSANYLAPLNKAFPSRLPLTATSLPLAPALINPSNPSAQSAAAPTALGSPQRPSPPHL
eukprot:CAMPEP_0177624968 /NCGR_PEP_ID=MMETSP0419_2-20121207/29815_1 /TAXON_ID=582737 /ORGANISM="Tetraselmis sp., Strain GSL018" /LENGTH=85 /DNA_ID=CAMNT_0019125815 /DNA_START=202 /DNA_END=456 /DNA_ORIENTATION=-